MLSVFIVALLSTPAISADKQAPPQKTLTFMNTMNDEENETLTELISQYSQKHPEIKIQVENVSFYDAKSVIENRFKENNLPDIMRVEIRLVVPFAKKGMFYPLDSFISTEDYVDYLPYLYKFCVIDGRNLFGIPQVTDCLVLFYNKTLFSDAKLEEPKSMEQFLSAACKLTVDEEGNHSDSTSFNQYKIAKYGFSYHFESYYLLPFVFSYGGNLCDEKGNSMVNSENTKAALKMIYDLKNRYKAVPAKIDPKFGHDFTLMEFMDGRVAMIIDGPWNIKKILKGNVFANKKNALGIFPIPRKQVSGSPIGGQFLTVSAKSKYPKESYEFINFINSKESQIIFGKQNYILPTRKSALDEIQKDLTEPEYSIRKGLYEQMKLAALYAFNIPDPAYLDEMNKMLEKLLNGNTGFEESLKELEKKFNMLVKNRN
ncbi:MAG TPA: extracellular solute-binding protein [Candidatus Wallbacteria bacterium]|nr:extracellular solute-binding protein [Candidatus Wallbacteria bacterium]